MKAAVYARTAPDGVTVADVPRPRLVGGTAPGRQHAICRVHAAGVNPVDAKFLYGDKLPPICLPIVQRLIEGSVCGIDFSGVVTEVPDGCAFAVGDRVFGTIPPLAGTFAEYVCAPTHSVARMPDTLSFAEASAIPLVGLTALQAFDDNGLWPGQHVLVLGASGGTGHAAVQIAKIRGATVTAVCGTRNVDFVRGLGADRIVAYDAGDCIAPFAAIVREHGPFDLVFDTVSSHDPRDARFDYERRIRGATPPLLGARGKYVFIGGQVGDWIRAHVKRFLGIDLFPHGRELFWVRFPNSAAQLAELGRFWEAKRLRVTVAATLPFTAAGVREAFALQMSRHAVGKLVIDVAGQSPPDLTEGSHQPTNATTQQPGNLAPAPRKGRPMPASQPFVVHAESCEVEGWDDPVLGAVTWRTLLSGDRTPTAGLTVGVVDIGPGHGERSFPHRHAPAEVYFVLAGEGVVTIDGTEHPVRTGSAVFIPGNVWHATRNTGPDVLRMLYAFPVDSFADVHYEFPAAAGDGDTR